MLEASVFEQFWAWLSQLRILAADGGMKLRVYCYNERAEDAQLRRIPDQLGTRDEVEAFIGSDEWVDLMQVFELHMITGGPTGLKSVAPLAAFGWEVADPGGDVSMAYYDDAVSTTEADLSGAARNWLLTYNRNDLEVTRALRDWPASTASSCPSVENLRY
jgi:predicted RecB family nuclease